MLSVLSRGGAGGRAVPLTLVLLLATLPASSSPESPSNPGEESFIRALEASPPDAALDRKRLAKLFFSLGATLDGGKSSVALLRSSVRVRDGSADSVRGTVNDSYGRYAESVERFMGSVSGLLDRPDSTAQLFLALSDGYEACWRLTDFTSLVETYGGRSQDLLSVLSSTEACARFRRVAFQPVVTATIVRDLDDAEFLRREARDLKFELDELERLLQDLRHIEAGE